VNACSFIKSEETLKGRNMKKEGGWEKETTLKKRSVMAGKEGEVGVNRRGGRKTKKSAGNHSRGEGRR